MALIQIRYCRHIGLSKPSAAISSSRDFAVADTSFWLSIRSTTLPGMSLIVTKTIRLANTSVTASASSLRIT